MRRASALKAASNASNIVLMVERRMMFPIRLRNPLFCLPTVMYFGSLILQTTKGMGFIKVINNGQISLRVNLAILSDKF